MNQEQAKSNPMESTIANKSISVTKIYYECNRKTVWKPNVNIVRLERFIEYTKNQKKKKNEQEKYKINKPIWSIPMYELSIPKSKCWDTCCSNFQTSTICWSYLCPICFEIIETKFFTNFSIFSASRVISRMQCNLC